MVHDRIAQRKKQRGLARAPLSSVASRCFVWSALVAVAASGQRGLAWAGSSCSSSGGGGGHSAEEPHTSSTHTAQHNCSCSARYARRRQHSSSSSGTTFVPTSVTAATAIPSTIVLRPGGSLADRCAGILGVDPLDAPHQRHPSHDFLQRLRAEEEQEASAFIATASPKSQASFFWRLPSIWSQTVSSSLLLVLASVAIELDWVQLGRELHKASAAAVSILWIPWFWVLPGQWTIADAWVYVPLVVRPSVVVHLWDTVLRPFTIPTLQKMIVAEAWSMLWKSLLLPLLPRFPKQTETWLEAALVFVGQAMHKGTLKLFTSRVQQHLQGAFNVLWNKGVKRLGQMCVWAANAYGNLMGPG